MSRRKGSVGARLQSSIEQTLSRRKPGPRETGRSKVKLASERAGIKPMTAKRAREEAATGFEWAGKKTSFIGNNASAWKMPAKQTNVDVDAWSKNAVGEQAQADETELRKVFEEVDLDNSNTIELDEFISAFKNLPGLMLDEPQLVKLFRSVDTDGSGGIDFEEFKVAYNQMDIVKSFMQQQLKAAGISTRKAGPRELRQGKTKVRLASERAGIRPAHCMDNVADPKTLFKVRSNSTGGAFGLGRRRNTSKERQRSNSGIIRRPAGVNRSGLAPRARGRKNGIPTASIQKEERGRRGAANPGMIKRFGAAAKAQAKPELEEAEIRATFDHVDIDGSGSIELDEFIAALKQMNVAYDVHQATQLFKEIDTDGSGAIDFEEFKAGYDKIDVVQAFIEQQCKAAGLSTRKVGPRELGRAARLTSQRAGIRSMTAADAAANAAGKFWKKAVPKSSLKGFSTTKLNTYANDMGEDSAPVRKEGPRGRGSHWGGDAAGKLWSVQLGIEPTNASREREMARKAVEEAKGKRDISRSTLRGFSSTVIVPGDYNNKGRRSGVGVAGGDSATALWLESRRRGSAGAPPRSNYANGGRGIRAINRGARGQEQAKANAKKKGMEELKDAFSRVDLDNSNSIEIDEFASALKFLGSEMDAYQMDSLFRKLDADGNGTLDFEEFAAGYEQIDVMKVFIEKSLKSAGLSTRKAGPREIGRSKKLASELAGIKPMTAAEAAANADPNFTAPKVTAMSLQGFGVKRKDNRPRGRAASLGNRR